MSSINIVHTRVDNRLVHGQVGNIWATFVGTNLIVVVDDEVAKNTIQQSLMKMTADAVGVGIRFFSIEKTIQIINKAAPSQKIFLVAKEPSTILKLVEGNVPIKECNIGNMHFSEGKKVYKEEHVYVNEKDIADFTALKEKGVKLYIQMTPNDRKIKI